jgi:NAD(P)-dependent dehydrogenase (short-subunit alcohol dehydrogenase family)
MGRRFLEFGAELAICGRRAEVLDEAAREHAEATGGEVTTHVCDVRDVQAVEAMLERLFAARPLAALVSIAAGNFLARSEELSPRAVDAVLGIVLKGSLNCTLPAAGAGSPRATPAPCSALPGPTPGAAPPTCCPRRSPRRACWP